MAACPACTFINADDATACEMCGAQLGTRNAPPTDAAVKACAHCTLENAADASACVACGAWWCPRCTRCVPAAVACCDVCSYPDDAAAPVADAAPPAPITPDDVANKDYRPRRVERALAAMPLDALERIVDEPARFVALACGEQPPAARPVGRVADPEPGEPAAGRVADDASEDGADAESDDDEDFAAAEKLLAGADACPVCGATATTRELLVAHCVARHVWDADEVRRRRAARPPKKKRRRRTADDDLDDFIVADDEDVEEYDSSGS